MNIYFRAFTLFLCLTGEFSQAASIPNEVEEFFQNLTLSKENVGRSNKDAIVYFKTKINDDYGYNVTCDDGLLSTLSQWDCLMGLRKLFRLLNTQTMDTNPEFLGISKIIISTSNSYKVLNKNWNQFELVIPYDADEEDLARYVKFNLFEQKRVHERALLTQLSQEVKDAREQLNVDVEIDPSLTVQELGIGLLTLRDLGRTLNLRFASPNSVREPIVAVLIGTKNLDMGESRRHLVFSIDARNKAEQAKQHLWRQFSFYSAEGQNKLEKADRERWWAIQQFKVDIARMIAEFSLLRQFEPNLKIACGESDETSVYLCLRGLENFHTALAMLPSSLQHGVQQVIIDKGVLLGDAVRFTKGADELNTIRVDYSATPSQIAQKIANNISERMIRGQP